jgi:hypothetical protein
MDCIKCKKRPAGGTPTLCLPCLKMVAREWFAFVSNDRSDYELTFMRFKNFLNRLQRRSRRAWKRHNMPR